MLVPVLPMFEEAVNAYKAVAAAEDTTKIQQAEKHIGFRNNNHQG